MKKEFISDIIGLIEPNSGLVSKYLFKILEDPKDSISYRLKNVEELMGLSKKSLTNLEFFLVQHILSIASNQNESIDNLEFECKDLNKILKISNDQLNNLNYSLQDYLDKYQTMGNHCMYKLNYSIFWKTNYLELETEKSLTFEYLYEKFIKILYDEKINSNEEIDAKSFEDRFSIEQINPLLAYLQQIEVAESINYRRPQCTYFYQSFFLNKNNLYKEYKKINNDL